MDPKRERVPGLDLSEEKSSGSRSAGQARVQSIEVISTVQQQHNNTEHLPKRGGNNLIDCVGCDPTVGPEGTL